VAIHQNKGKWWTVILISSLGTAKTRSNLHTGQNAGSVFSDLNQGQVLVEPLLLPGWGHQTYQQVSLQGCSKKGGGLTIPSVLTSITVCHLPLLNA